MLHSYRQLSGSFEYCFNIEASVPLTGEDLTTLRWLLAETFEPGKFGGSPFLTDGEAIEFGPRLNFATAWSTNAVAICHALGLEKITRIERSRRYVVPAGEDEGDFIASHHDRMTECHYPAPLETFSTGVIPEPVFEIPILQQGIEALRRINKDFGLGMDEWDIQFYFKFFTEQEKRNPTIAEIVDLGNANSEHSRHGYFKGRQIIDGVEMQETLLEIVKLTLAANPGNSLIAFRDNSSGIRGFDIWTIIPAEPGRVSSFVKKRVRYHIIFTAETHNFPTGIAPFPGAETGTGGRIRDVQATGQGGLVVAGTAGYCVANLLIPGYDLPWEDASFVYPSEVARALGIEIGASNGASDYGNKFGEPLILGFTRSADLRLASGERWGWIKPIMFTGGIGQIDDRHITKGEAVPGLLIVQVGGPAYRIGFGGGAASSQMQGDNTVELDFNAVQRGDGEMENKMNRVIRACIEMGEKNPIVIIHDQGAGGPANILKELMEKAGGRIDIRKIKVGDQTLSVLVIWVAEFQERCGFLIHPDRIEEFKAICAREKVNCEVLGEVTGDGRFVVEDSRDGSIPVNIDLESLLGKMPQKTFRDSRIKPVLKPLRFADFLVRGALGRVLRLVSIGSKRFLTTKVDRSVTGLIARQQGCGPLQLTVADVAVIAQSHFSLTGAATAIGEQPIKMLVNPAAGARMAVGEALTNLVWALITSLSDIKCSANWMWAPKLPGEGAALYEAACAMRDLMIKLGIAVDGGKDSLSMATRVGDEIVKSPRQLVISAYAPMLNITKVITPDIKRPGESELIFIDLSRGRNRLGGSALAQVFGQIGDESPDVEAALLQRAFIAIQKMTREDLILAGHDRSDGGLITTLLEMAFAGNCGLDLALKGDDSIFEKLFSEELGLAVECDPGKRGGIEKILENSNIPFSLIGKTSADPQIVVSYNGEEVLSESMLVLRQEWEETSHQLDLLQANPECVREEEKNIFARTGPKYFLSFDPEPTAPVILSAKVKPRVAIIREEGTNGDREMASAFFLAGFEPWDITMADLLAGEITLDGFRGVVFPGGFSYADVLDSAKGWAGVIRFNETLRKMFDDFFNRPDTFSLGVCNGCQLMALLGWVPWQGICDNVQPRFIKNLSGRFESRWVTVKILPSPAIMFQGMADSVLGIWVAHGEGRLYFPDPSIHQMIQWENLAPIVYVDDSGKRTESYPFNPNGSPLGTAALCSRDGRHLAMMPHPERVSLPWQWPWQPQEWKNLKASPWLKMFQNARQWCEQS